MLARRSKQQAPFGSDPLLDQGSNLVLVTGRKASRSMLSVVAETGASLAGWCEALL